MKIKIKFSKEKFNYSIPIPVRGHVLKENEALVVSVNEKISIPFVSLPLFHQSGLTELHEQLELVFSNMDLNFDKFDYNKPNFNLFNYHPSNGEILYAIESILFQITKMYHPNLFGQRETQNIHTCSLGEFHPNSSKSILKLKISNIKIDQQFHHIQKLAIDNPNLKLRLDGNKLFNLPELTNYFDQLFNIVGEAFISRIIYLEEPTSSLDEYVSFYKKYPIPLAFDESLNDLSSLNNLQKYHSVASTFVVKPSLIGVSTSLQILKKVQALNKNCIISSSFESGVNFEPLLFLATFLPEQYHGLDTLKFQPKHLAQVSDIYNFIY